MMGRVLSATAATALRYSRPEMLRRDSPARAACWGRNRDTTKFPPAAHRPDRGSRNRFCGGSRPLSFLSSIYANDLKSFQGSKQVRQPLSDIEYDVVEQVCGGRNAGERHGLYLLDVEDLRARVHQCELVAVRCPRQRLTRCPQEHSPRLDRAPACAVNFDVNHDS